MLNEEDTAGGASIHSTFNIEHSTFNIQTSRIKPSYANLIPDGSVASTVA
jgi:hypothetical protein